MANVKSLETSNETIIRLLNGSNKFFIARLGIGDETHITVHYLRNKRVTAEYLAPQINLNGIYSKTNNLRDYEAFCLSYDRAIANCDVLASFTFNSRNIIGIQQFFAKRHNLPQIHSKALEPFYCCMSNIKPWSHYLLGKKVLIVNPFTESMKRQLAAGFQIFKDPSKRIFLDGQEFVFYKSYQTIAGNHLHSSWRETFSLMCNDIRKLNFDIALLGCGGYGLPLCNFIKSDLNKSAIYVGGGLQLLFGVMGNRWAARPEWQEIIRENGCKFVKPSPDEAVPNKESIEGGCYW